jgi:hypothetical protein
VIIMLLVVITARDRERVSEALRAAIGLGLRGDPVATLVIGGPLPDDDPRIARALGTLDRLGRPARAATIEEARAAARTARAVEVWTDPGSRRLLDLGAASVDPASVDSRRLVEQIFDADAAVLW